MLMLNKHGGKYKMVVAFILQLYHVSSIRNFQYIPNNTYRLDIKVLSLLHVVKKVQTLMMLLLKWFQSRQDLIGHSHQFYDQPIFPEHFCFLI